MYPYPWQVPCIGTVPYVVGLGGVVLWNRLDLPPHLPGWHYIFRIRNPELKLYFATGILVGGSIQDIGLLRNFPFRGCVFQVIAVAIALRIIFPRKNNPRCHRSPKKKLSPKFNIAPEKRWLEDVGRPLSHWEGEFSVAMLNFVGVYLWKGCFEITIAAVFWGWRFAACWILVNDSMKIIFWVNSFPSFKFLCWRNGEFYDHGSRFKKEGSLTTNLQVSQELDYGNGSVY